MKILLDILKKKNVKPLLLVFLLFSILFEWPTLRDLNYGEDILHCQSPKHNDSGHGLITARFFLVQALSKSKFFDWGDPEDSWKILNWFLCTYWKAHQRLSLNFDAAAIDVTDDPWFTFFLPPDSMETGRGVMIKVGRRLLPYILWLLIIPIDVWCQVGQSFWNQR